MAAKKKTDFQARTYEKLQQKHLHCCYWPRRDPRRLLPLEIQPCPRHFQKVPMTRPCINPCQVHSIRPHNLRQQNQDDVVVHHI
jgi:hypothetical protein